MNKLLIMLVVGFGLTSIGCMNPDMSFPSFQEPLSVERDSEAKGNDILIPLILNQRITELEKNQCKGDCCKCPKLAQPKKNDFDTKVEPAPKTVQQQQSGDCSDDSCNIQSGRRGIFGRFR